MCPRLRREARVVAADDDADVWLDRPDERDDSTRRAALKGHHRQPDQLGLEIAHQPLDRAAHRRLHEHQVGDRDAVMRVDIPGQRRQRAVGHPDRHRRGVLERIGHRQEQNPHRLPPDASDRAFSSSSWRADDRRFRIDAHAVKGVGVEALIPNAASVFVHPSQRLLKQARLRRALRYGALEM